VACFITERTDALSSIGGGGGGGGISDPSPDITAGILMGDGKLSIARGGGKSPIGRGGGSDGSESALGASCTESFCC